MKRREITSGGIRITKVGFGFLLFGLVLLVAAANTGNNGLYLVLAVMAGMLVVAQLASALNVRGLEVQLRSPIEIFANRPASFGLTVRNRSRFLGRRLLLAVLERGRARPGRRAKRRSAPLLISLLAARAEARGEVEVMVGRRGWWRHATVEISGLFPIGFFHKIMRHRKSVDVLVYPEIFPLPTSLPRRSGTSGEQPSARRGWGHDLAGLRPFRAGDDPRGIHWKQTARTGALVFKESAAEDSQRLSVIFDNGAGVLEHEEEKVRFERLVSEAATAGLAALARGDQVELVTRGALVPFASGARQRRKILEALALIQPVAATSTPLVSGAPAGHQVRLAMKPQAPAAGAGAAV